MKYEFIEYTRNLTTDYHYEVRPDRLPASFDKVIPQLIYLRDGFRDDERIEWDKILFFLRCEDEDVVCQIVSNGNDYVGRTIYSVRGLLAASDDYRAILAIPDLLMEINNNGFNAVPEIEDTINPLIASDVNQAGGCEGVEREMPTYLKKIIEDIRTASLGYSCVIGPYAEDIYMAIGNLQIDGVKVFESYYDTTKEYELAGDVKGFTVLKPTNEESIGEDEMDAKKCARLYIRFYRDGKLNGSYEWILERQYDGLCIKSRRHRFRESLNLSELFAEEKRIRRYYTLLGFEFV